MSDAKAQVDLPSLALVLTGGLGVVLYLFNILSTLLGGGFDPADLEGLPPETVDQLMPFLEMAESGGIVMALIGLAMSGVVIYGGLQMRGLENRGLSVAASIVAMIPCIGPCCCIGLPVGIWSLIVLGKDEVKAAFKS